MIEYLICSTPRTGGNLLCDLLRQMEIGCPGEYLEPHAASQLMPELGIRRSRDYPAALRTKFTVNGIYGLKIDMEQFCAMRAAGFARDPYDLFAGRPHFIRLTRKDTLRQAVSRSIAYQNQIWARPAGQPEDRTRIVYDRDSISECLDKTLASTQRWEHWFEEEGINPLRIVYEDLVEFRRETLGEILGYIGVSMDSIGIQTPEPVLAKQADALNDEFCQRYREEV